MDEIREQIKELRRNQGYGGSEIAADTMEKLLAENDRLRRQRDEARGSCDWLITQAKGMLDRDQTRRATADDPGQKS